MATKKQTSRKPAAKSAAPAKKTNSQLILGIGAVVIVAIAAIVWFASSKPSSAIPADEQKYLGRLLPASYQEPSVGGQQSYSSAIKMTEITATKGKDSVSIPTDQLIADKIVYFEYTRADGQQLPMVAYVKPSGKLFVGVSFCLPCKGTKQRIENGQLVCESCGTIRDLETGAGISGTCRLYPLDEVPATVSGGTISIANSVLDQWTAQPLDRKVGA